MLNIFITASTIVLIIIVILSVYFLVWPIIKYYLKYNKKQIEKQEQMKMENWNNQNVGQLVQEFLTSTSSDDLGLIFGKLVERGFFVNLMTVNHGIKNNDNRRVADFKNSMNSASVNVLRGFDAKNGIY